MRTLLVALGITAFSLFAFADGLSLEQQTKISQIVTERTVPAPAGKFTIAIGERVPPEITLQPLPPEAEAVAPALKGSSYVIVEETVAIVAPSREISHVMQRMRRQ